MKATLFACTAALAATLLIGMGVTLAPRQAAATPQFTQQTGKPCGFCHTQPPTLNDQGKAFKAKGNKL